MNSARRCAATSGGSARGGPGFPGRAAGERSPGTSRTESRLLHVSWLRPTHCDRLTTPLHDHYSERGLWRLLFDDLDPAKLPSARGRGVASGACPTRTLSSCLYHPLRRPSRAAGSRHIHAVCNRPHNALCSSVCNSAGPNLVNLACAPHHYPRRSLFPSASTVPTQTRRHTEWGLAGCALFVRPAQSVSAPCGFKRHSEPFASPRNPTGSFSSPSLYPCSRGPCRRPPIRAQQLPARRVPLKSSFSSSAARLPRPPPARIRPHQTAADVQVLHPPLLLSDRPWASESSRSRTRRKRCTVSPAVASEMHRAPRPQPRPQEPSRTSYILLTPTPRLLPIVPVRCPHLHDLRELCCCATRAVAVELNVQSPDCDCVLFVSVWLLCLVRTRCCCPRALLTHSLLTAVPPKASSGPPSLVGIVAARLRAQL